MTEARFSFLIRCSSLALAVLLAADCAYGASNRSFMPPTPMPVSAASR